MTNDADWTGTVTVTRWDIAEQVYDLTVKLEDSAETGIEYVRVNTTEATASATPASMLCCPKNYNGNNQTHPDAVNVVIRTIPSITAVQINNAKNASGNSPVVNVVNMVKIDSDTDPDYVSGQTAWKLLKM